MDATETYSLVDKLVLIDAEIKKLEKRRNELKEQVIAMGEGTHGGHAGSISVSLQNRKNLSSSKLKAKFGEEAIEDCYETNASIVVRVTKFDKEVS